MSEVLVRQWYNGVVDGPGSEELAVVALRIPLPKPFADVLERTQRQETEALDWESVRQEWEATLATHDSLHLQFDDSIEKVLRVRSTDPRTGLLESEPLWRLLWANLLLWASVRGIVDGLGQAPIRSWVIKEVEARYQRIIVQTQMLLVAFPQLAFPGGPEIYAALCNHGSVEWMTPEVVGSLEQLRAEVLTIRISPLAHLRAMWNLWWSAVRHPLSETTIDLSTGRVLSRA
ncbi:MAG: hypothetical protein U0804_03455 [Gemmataceae bacterium]